MLKLSENTATTGYTGCGIDIIMSIVFYPIHLILTRRNNQYFSIYLILFVITPAFTEFRLPDEIHGLAFSAIENIYNNDLKKAEEEAKEIIKKFPESPAGYFFYAVILDFWMIHYQSNEKENEFYRYCDLAIEKSEKILQKNPSDEWAIFFMGGADGYKGTYEARYERWITAFRYGWKGVSVLLELQEKDTKITDIYYGIGSYNYWRSAMMKTLWFMPSINDKRQEGIRMLYEAQKKGVYTKITASVALIDILISEKQYAQALQISQQRLSEYPDALIFKWGQARSLFGQNRFDKALEVYKTILNKVESDPQNNHYNAAICHLEMAKIYQKLADHEKAILECNRMKYYNFDSDVEKRLDKYFNEAKSIARDAMQAQIKQKKE